MKFLIPLFLLATMACTSNSSSEKEAPIRNTTNFDSYGDPIILNEALTTSEMLQKMQNQDSLNTRVEGVIVQSCAMKGCWMDVAINDGSVMKVRFKDYGFFVPKEGLEGKIAIMEGFVTRELVDVQTLRHYAEDAGKSKEEIASITEPEVKLNFEASGVAIKH